MTALLLGVVLVNALGVFWPAPVALCELDKGKRVIGELIREEAVPGGDEKRIQLKTGNSEFQADFQWHSRGEIRATAYPADVFVLEREKHGDFYGFLKELHAPVLGDGGAATRDATASRLAAALAAIRDAEKNDLRPIEAEASHDAHLLKLNRWDIAAVEYRRARQAADGKDEAARLDAQLTELRRVQDDLMRASDEIRDRHGRVSADLAANVARFEDASGSLREVPLTTIVRAYQPNSMGVAGKVLHYGAKIVELLWDNPRNVNTEGGLFPTIFGTVILVFLMSIFCFPLGVLAGVYLGEYAREGFLVRLVRIGVNNLAGIPSIVYGVFGMGFFIYTLGTSMDRWLYPDRPAGETVFGTGGILWASITLGLLTIPVVIVATEEALRTIPRSIREGSYALGATKFQTLRRVLLPIASPGIMTGFILAMARAAGEVAPLMITGVIKVAPALAMDGEYPFFHVDRKFQHLGFHIYDLAFQSKNAEAAKPMIYVATLLLLLIVLTMNSLAIYLRNKMRKRYQLKSI
jgi:phosphate transport system permease protein